MGKRTIAQMIAANLAIPAHIAFIEPDEKGTIGIETVRSLYQRTRTRQEGRQVVILDGAEAMGIEAQNAFLKLLEEPRDGVVFILTTPNEDALLPTIHSRAQSITIPRVAPALLRQMAEVRSPGLQPQELAQLLFVADGRPATLVRLLDDPGAFSRHKQLMKQAKDLLGASQYERLALISTLGKGREEAITLLEAMSRILQIQLLHHPDTRLLRLADDIQECLDRLAQNGNPRAQLTSLFARH